MLKELFELQQMSEDAYRDYCASRPLGVGYPGDRELFTRWRSKSYDYNDKQIEWDAVLDVVNNAILDKLEAPVFDESSDDDDVYGLLYREKDEPRPPISDGDYVVSSAAVKWGPRKYMRRYSVSGYRPEEGMLITRPLHVERMAKDFLLTIFTKK